MIDASKEDFVEAAHRICGRLRVFGAGGVDVVLNDIGGDTWARSLKCMKRDDRMLTCGATTGFEPLTDIRFIRLFEQSIIGSNGWHLNEQRRVLELVADGKLTPVIHAARLSRRSCSRWLS